MSLRRYLVLGLVIGIVVLLLGLVGGPGIANWISGIRDQGLRAGVGAISNLIADPLIWIMMNPIPGAIGVAIAWPFLIVWIALLFILIVLGFGADAARDLNSSLSLFWS